MTRVALLALLVTFALLLAGCGGGGGSGGGGGVRDATYLFVNLSPDSAPLDLLLDNTVSESDVTYGNRATGFRSAPEELVDLTLRTQDGTEADVIAHTFAPGTDVLVLALGLQTVPGTEFLKRLRIRLAGVNRAAPVGDRARLIVVNAYVERPGFDTPDLTFQNPGLTPLTKVTNIGFGDVREVVVDSGASDWEMRVSDADPLAAALASTNTTLAAGGVYVAVMGGLEGSADPTRRPAIRFISVPTR